jgi:hypothetical protein
MTDDAEYHARLSLVGTHVRVEWPEHQTHRWIGRIEDWHRCSSLYVVRLQQDGEVRGYEPGRLVQVRQLVTWVDVSEPQKVQI